MLNPPLFIAGVHHDQDRERNEKRRRQGMLGRSSRDTVRKIVRFKSSEKCKHSSKEGLVNFSSSKPLLVSICRINIKFASSKHVLSSFYERAPDIVKR